MTVTKYDAENYIDAVVKLPSVKLISFTGGEPMLYPKLVEELIAYASGYGLKTELVTNCEWAETIEQTTEVLGKLRDAGLVVLNLSADDFHQSKIPLERVRNCYVAAKRLEIKMVVMTSLSRSSRLKLVNIAEFFGDDIPVPFLADPSRDAVIGIESGFIPVGRGAFIPKEELLLNDAKLEGFCGEVLSDIGVKPNGDVLACCSACSVLPAFSIGNLKNSGLSEILDKAKSKELFRILKESGPAGFASASNDRYVSKCHLCYEIIKKL
jgi:radical SAM protein with 4Fe4S-binding SPASM domain